MTKTTRQHILVAGANGFIGRNLCIALRAKGYFIRGVVRNNARDVSGISEYIQVGDINGSTDWQAALARIDTVVHLAGRAHVMHERVNDSLEEFRKVNVIGTECLARMSAKVGVKRFVFASSVKVNGEGRELPYTEEDVPKPEDAYGVSKMEAEQALKRIASETGLDVVILRLPLVYGPGVKANFKNLMKLAVCGLPLPFKSINNKRSLLYVGNLVDAIVACIDHPKAAGETFLVSDGQDISTPDLMKMIVSAMGKKANLFSFPLGILRLLCKTIGKGDELEKLTGTLIVDSSKIRNLLGWNPAFTLEEGIKETVKWYQNAK